MDRGAQRGHGSEGCGMTVKRLPGKGGILVGASSDFDYMVEGREDDRQALAKKAFLAQTLFFNFLFFQPRTRISNFPKRRFYYSIVSYTIEPHLQSR